MTKQIKITHITITAVAWGLFFFSLIRLLIVYNSLAEEIGVHFDGKGEFDVIASKKFVAYPYAVSLISLVLCEILALFSQKVNIGLKISEIGEKKIREALIILLDTFKFGYSFFYAGVWADCVIRQYFLNTAIPNAILVTFFILFIAFIVFSVIVKIRNSHELTGNIKNQNKF